VKTSRERGVKLVSFPFEEKVTINNQEHNTSQANATSPTVSQIKVANETPRRRGHALLVFDPRLETPSDVTAPPNVDSGRLGNRNIQPLLHHKLTLAFLSFSYLTNLSFQNREQKRRSSKWHLYKLSSHPSSLASQQQASTPDRYFPEPTPRRPSLLMPPAREQLALWN
jgi:hypothetical protein